MLIVNFFAGAHAGKTLLRLLTCAELKMAPARLDVEEAKEIAKEHLREGRDFVIRNRIKMLGDQLHRTIQHQNVDVVVTDSPVLLDGFYARQEGWPECFVETCRYAHFMQPSLNVWVERQTEFGYDGRARHQDENKAKQNDGELLAMLREFGVNYMTVKSSREGAKEVARAVLRRLGKSEELAP